jgi:hypothetical protein
MLIIHGINNVFRYTPPWNHLVHFCPVTTQAADRTWATEGYECFMCKETLPEMYQLAHKIGEAFEYKV